MLLHLWPDRTNLRRKLRLFACAACRQCGDGPYDERGWRAVEMAEQFADGLIPKREMAAARAAVKRGNFPHAVANDLAWNAALFAVARATPVGGATAILLDIFENPFCPPSPVAPHVLAWNNGTVVRLAEAAYEERMLPEGTLNAQRLSVLADALLDAGCTDAVLLDHLRGPGPHLRGCWAVDHLLGREGRAGREGKP